MQSHGKSKFDEEIISIVLLLLVALFLVTQICNFFDIQKKNYAYCSFHLS